MPNKKEAVETFPKESDNLISTNNVSNSTDHTKDVVSTVSRKGNNTKRKNKSAKAVSVQNETDTKDEPMANRPNINSITNEEIRAVSDELLRRLHLNGTSVSVCKPNIDNEMQSISNQAQSNATKLYSNGGNADQDDQSKEKHKQINNNSNKLHNKNDYNQCQSTQLNSSSDDTNLSGNSNVQCNGICTKMETSNCCTVIPHMGMNISVENCPQPSTSNLHSVCDINSLASSQSALSIKSIKTDTVEITFQEYENELQMPDIMRVIQRELSEPYSIYTYRYFIHNWPKLCFLAMDGNSCIGAIVCKLDIHRQMTKRGYIAMLAVDAAYRKLKVGTTLVQKAIEVSTMLILFKADQCSKLHLFPQ